MSENKKIRDDIHQMTVELMNAFIELEKIAAAVREFSNTFDIDSPAFELYESMWSQFDEALVETEFIDIDFISLVKDTQIESKGHLEDWEDDE